MLETPWSLLRKPIQEAPNEDEKEKGL